MPSFSSHRLDQKRLALTEICSAICHTEAIPVWEHIFAPREYLSGQLEEFFAKYVPIILVATY